MRLEISVVEALVSKLEIQYYFLVSLVIQLSKVGLNER